MKQSFFIMILLGLFALTTNAQQISSAGNDSIKFDKLVHDYGTVEKGSDGSSTFSFINKGNKPLIITNVRASCGCTVPEWPKQPIAPGLGAEIKVKYNTNIAGNFNKTITVVSNAANSPVVLRVRGVVNQ